MKSSSFRERASAVAASLGVLLAGVASVATSDPNGGAFSSAPPGSVIASVTLAPQSATKTVRIHVTASASPNLAVTPYDPFEPSIASSGSAFPKGLVTMATADGTKLAVQYDATQTTFFLDDPTELAKVCGCPDGGAPDSGACGSCVLDLDTTFTLPPSVTSSVTFGWQVSASEPSAPDGGASPALQIVP
jgi:hypothetical protein